MTEAKYILLPKNQKAERRATEMKVASQGRKEVVTVILDVSGRSWYMGEEVESAERLKEMSRTDLRPWSFCSMVRLMRRTRPRTRETMPVGMIMKERVTTDKATRMKLKEFLSSTFSLFLSPMINGRRKESRKERAPRRPVVVMRVKMKLLDSEKRILQILVLRLRYTGRRRVKAER